MTFKEDYHALFDQLHPSEQLLAATAAMNRRPNPTPLRRFRLPAVAVSLCTICLLIVSSFAASLQPGQTAESLNAEQQPQMAKSRSLEPGPEIAEYSTLATEPQIAAYNNDAPEKAASPSQAGRIACYPEADDKMALIAAPPLHIWRNSPSLPACLYQTAIWFMHWTQSK